MRAVAVALSLLCLGSPTSARERLPTFPKRTTYFDARVSLKSLGWQPVSAPEAVKCEADDSRCAGRPEMLFCSGTGLARCGFLWKKGDTLIQVDTFGEEEPIRVDKVACRAGC